MTRPLLVIFLTIFVNLVGFGIIVPLLPFYAERFGASPFVIGLLFGIFSLCQLVAAPALGDLSDRYGRRPVLIFSLLGTVLSSVRIRPEGGRWLYRPFVLPLKLLRSILLRVLRARGPRRFISFETSLYLSTIAVFEKR